MKLSNKSHWLEFLVYFLYKVGNSVRLVSRSRDSLMTIHDLFRSLFT